MSDSNKRYNGWLNYETWAVALWIDNDEGPHEYWREAAREAYRDLRDEDTEAFSRSERAAANLAERLKDEIEEGNPLASDASMYSDLLGAALGEVNWDEIATHYVDDVKDDIDSEEAEEAEEDRQAELDSQEDIPDPDLTVSGTDHTRWEQLGIPEVELDRATFFNQQPDFGDSDRGEWFTAPDAPTMIDGEPHYIIIGGTFGNDHSPGASHYTSAYLYKSKEDWEESIRILESRPEYL